MKKNYRIGIDVGGTFTDAVVIDGDTYQIVAKQKIQTTHEEGVAYGIIRIINAVLQKAQIAPEDVTFIAHGTTQATNALLEGDVASVGIIGMGKGIDGYSARSETNVPLIELSPGKHLRTAHVFLDSSALRRETVEATIDSLTQQGTQVILASEAYSVDDPTNEDKVRAIAMEKGLYATAGHEISQLYGLKMRTRTALVNASLVPCMMETADMTERAVKNAGIESRLMIMRCDGGVMSIDEVKKRPILTMLSGLAAGVAGALMSEKVSDGVFFEVGGTSIDISAIKNGQVMIKYSQVGGHKTYLRSVDVRTIAVAGGTMIKVRDGKIVDVGPRSAHIAGKGYECFAPCRDGNHYTARFISPKEGDPEEYVVCGDDGGEYALTLTGAANLLGYVPEGDYAAGNREEAGKAWQALANHMGNGMTAEGAARQALDLALDKVMVVVKELIAEYDIQTSFISLVGGGGGASVIVPALGQREGISWRIAQYAPYISTIGVALAMVREQIERTVVNPSEEDIARIRAAVIEQTVRAGAQEETIEVTIEIDTQHSLIRAMASGATELRTKVLGATDADPEKLRDIAAAALLVDPAMVFPKAVAGRWTLFETVQKEKKLFGLVSTNVNAVCMVDREGVVRFKRRRANLLVFRHNQLNSKFHDFLDSNTLYSDANATLPAVFIFYREKTLDLSGLQEAKQLMSILSMELYLLSEDEKIIAVAYQNR